MFGCVGRMREGRMVKRMPVVEDKGGEEGEEGHREDAEAKWKNY